MKVSLIACTTLNELFEGDENGLVRKLDGTPYQIHKTTPVTYADELAEFAGRACYESWDRPNPATATNQGYLDHILEVKHFSILEHASATFYITDVPRSFTHELVRHRHMSYSQLSQRYVDESEANLVLPPNGDDWEADKIRQHFKASKRLYAELVEHREEILGQPRKKAREAGRAVLPNATETRIVVTGNMRAWRELIQKRNTEGADAAFKLIAAELLRQLKGLAPNTFQDM
jgi:thymidylate synthase (FAD)